MDGPCRPLRRHARDRPGRKGQDEQPTDRPPVHPFLPLRNRDRLALRVFVRFNSCQSAFTTGPCAAKIGSGLPIARGRTTAGTQAEKAKMIKPRRIGHATFETPDLEKAIAYHTEVNGLALAAREKDRAFLATKIGQLVVQLDQGDEARCIKLSFEVAPNSDFNALSRELGKEG